MLGMDAAAGGCRLPAICFALASMAATLELSEVSIAGGSGIGTGTGGTYEPEATVGTYEPEATLGTYEPEPARPPTRTDREPPGVQDRLEGAETKRITCEAPVRGVKEPDRDEDPTGSPREPDITGVQAPEAMFPGNEENDPIRGVPTRYLAEPPLSDDMLSALGIDTGVGGPLPTGATLKEPWRGIPYKEELLGVSAPSPGGL